MFIVKVRNDMIISIKNNEQVEPKYGFRAFMMFENILNKSFTIENTTDVVTFFFCTYLAGKGSASWDEFLDYIDEHQELVAEFSEWLTEKIAGENKKKEIPTPKKGKAKAQNS